MDKKYFFFDIDGTIAVGIPRYIPESTERTIKKLKEKGHFVSIATGRMYSMTKEFTEKLGIDTLVTDGGNGIVINGVEDIKPLEKKEIIELVDELNEKGIPWAICRTQDRLWTTKDNSFPDVMREVMKNKYYMDTEIIKGFDIRDAKEIYKAFAYLTVEDEKKVDALKKVSYTRYDPNYIIIEQDDKSIGIERLIKKLGIDRNSVVVFGDNTNDLKMFKPEWIKIAMGNSVDALKKAADFVTKDADDDGIEYACRHFGWIE